MNNSSGFASTSCIEHVTQVANLLQGKWTLQILCAMQTSPVRLSQLFRLIPGASKKSLRANLRGLEGAGVVVRRDLSSTVLHVEYDVAENMQKAVTSVMFQLENWGRSIRGTG